MDDSLVEKLLDMHFLLFACSVLALILFVLLVVRKKLERRKLALAIRSIGNSSRMPARVSFKSTELNDAWSLIRKQRELLHRSDAKNRIQPQSSSFGAQLLSAEANSKEIAESLLRHIVARSGVELVGAAIILKEGRVEASHGIPIERLEEALLFCADYCFSNMPSSGVTYYDSSSAAQFDFSFFGIGRSMVSPLVNSGELIGIVWIGLRDGMLSPEILQSLEGLLEYASASFRSVGEMEKRVQGKDRERDFLLGLSHDLRSPGNRALFSIRDLLHDGGLSKEQTDALQAAEDSIVEQLGMLGNVLDLAKHDSGLLEPSRRSVALHELLSNIVRRFERDFKSKSLGLELKCDPTLRVFADPDHLLRICNNLVSNALKFTTSGGLFIEVVVESETILLYFTDTGAGVSGRDRASIFDRFSQGSKNKTGGGVGLGLFLSKTLAERNGGTLYFEEPSFSGSRFVLELVRAASKQVASRQSLSLESILIVEDDAPTFRVLKRYLSAFSSKFELASTVQQAEIILSEKSVSLVVSDYNIGNEKADALISRLASDVPLLIVSGEPKELLSRNLSRDAGVMGFLEKPIERTELHAAVVELLQTFHSNVVSESRRIENSKWLD